MTSRSSIPLREYTYLLYEIFIGIEAEASVLGIPQIGIPKYAQDKQTKKLSDFLLVKLQVNSDLTLKIVI